MENGKSMIKVFYRLGKLKDKVRASLFLIGSHITSFQYFQLIYLTFSTANWSSAIDLRRDDSPRRVVHGGADVAAAPWPGVRAVRHRRALGRL